MKLRKNIILMYAITFLQGMVFYSAVATLYRQAVGVSVFQITLIESISLALSLALELPCGILAEKIGYRRMMILCNVLYFISKIVFWQADDFGMFLIERILLGFIFAGLSGIDTSILYLSCEEDYVQRAFGFFDGLSTAGMLLAAGTYTVLLHGQYRMAALFTVVTYGLAMVLTFFLQEVKSTQEEETPPIREFFTILKDTLHRRDLLLFLLAAALSIYAILMDGVAITANLIYGQASDVNLSLALGLGAVFCLISLLCFLRSSK